MKDILMQTDNTIYNMIEDYLKNGMTSEVKGYIGALDAEELHNLMGEIHEDAWEWYYANQKNESRVDNPYNDIYDYLNIQTDEARTDAEGAK